MCKHKKVKGNHILSEGFSKIILLDRDGVINVDRSTSVCSIDQFEIIGGIPEAIGKLTQAGYRLLVITNQACVGRGEISPTVLDQIHQILQKNLAAYGGKIDDFFICPHVAEAECLCRKPKPGLIYQAMQRWHFLPETTWFVGDALRDIQAALAAGCKPALVRTGRGRQTEVKAQDVPVFENLSSFANHLLNTEKGIDVYLR